MTRMRRCWIGLTVMVAAMQARAQIPVTDVVGITTQVTNQVEAMARWAQQFQQMQQQLEQSRSQLKAMTGSRGMGSIGAGAIVDMVLPSDWQQVLSSVKGSSEYASERSRYPSYPLAPKANALYDVIAVQNVTTSELHEHSNERLRLVQQLMSEIDSAEDPAAKADLTNRLLNEQNAIQANQNLIQLVVSKQSQELAEASRQAKEEYLCKEFNGLSC